MERQARGEQGERLESWRIALTFLQLATSPRSPLTTCMGSPSGRHRQISQRPDRPECHPLLVLPTVLRWNEGTMQRCAIDEDPHEVEAMVDNATGGLALQLWRRTSTTFSML